MKKLILALLISSYALAGLPPTATKVSGDSNYATTFNFDFSIFSGTHTGTNLALGYLTPSGGGFGLSQSKTDIATTGTINNLTPTTGFLNFTGVSDVNLTGIVAQTQGTRVLIKNSLSVNKIIQLVNNSGSSSAGNRFLNPNSYPVVIQNGESNEFIYNGTNWVPSDAGVNSWTIGGNAPQTGTAYFGTKNTTNIVGIQNGYQWLGVDRSTNTGLLADLTTGSISVDFVNRILKSSDSSDSLDYQNRQLKYNSITRVDYVSGYLSDEYGVYAMGFTTGSPGRGLFNSSGVQLFDFNADGYLYDNSGNMVMSLTGRTLSLPYGAGFIDFSGGSSAVANLYSNVSNDFLKFNTGMGAIASVDYLGHFRAPDASASSPSFTFYNDVYTGFYLSGTSNIGVSAGASQVLNIGPSSMSFVEGYNMFFGSVTGSMIGTNSAQKLSFYGATPIVRPNGDVATALSNLGLVSGPSYSVSSISGVLPISKGGTGQATKAPAFDALSPMTTGGDLIYGGASGTGTRLANGSANDVLTSGGGTLAPSWTSRVSLGSVSATADTLVARDSSANGIGVRGGSFVTSNTSTATAAGTTTLTAASLGYQTFTGTTTQTVKMPVVTTLAQGRHYIFENRSTGLVTIQSSGANQILVMAPNSMATLDLNSNSADTTATPWAVMYMPMYGANKVNALSANTTLDDGYQYVTGNATSASFTVTLPACTSANYGRTFHIKKIDSSANTVTIARSGSDTIDGATSIVIDTQYRSYSVTCMASAAWYVF